MPTLEKQKEKIKLLEYLNKHSKKVMTVLISVAILLTAGTTAFYFINKGKEAVADNKAIELSKEEVQKNLNTFSLGGNLVANTENEISIQKANSDVEKLALTADVAVKKGATNEKSAIADIPLNTEISIVYELKDEQKQIKEVWWQ